MVRLAKPKDPLTREAIEVFERSHPTLKALNDATIAKSRGFEITTEQCAAICGGREAFERIKRMWQECVLSVAGITVVYKHSIRGYWFLPVDVHLTDRQQKLSLAAERRHRQEAVRLGLMRDADMATDHQRQMRAFFMQQHADTAGKIEAQREHARIAFQRPETLPRIS